MEDLNDKAANGQLTASEWNGTRTEIQNIIENAGITLSAGDSNQLGKAIADIIANGDFFTDSGTANAHVLTAVSSNQSPTAYKDGMRARYRVNVTNTGAVTVAIAGLAAKAVTIKNVALTGGELPAGESVVIEYHNANGKFNIVLNESVAGYRINGYSLIGASYDSKSLSVTAQSSASVGMFFKPDGLTVYMIEDVTDDIFQYTLTIAWDISTASYASKTFSTSEDTSPKDIFFKPDGTKMYMVGVTNDTVYQYSLSTAWDVSTATYDTVSKSVATEDTSPQGIFFKPDGTKMYIAGGTNDTVYQYTLPTPWVLTGASYDTVSKSVTTEETQLTTITFKDDGSKMYVAGTLNETVYQYSLPTAWVLTNAVYDSVSLNLAHEVIVITSLFFKDDGEKLYILDSTGDDIRQYSTNFLSAPK